MGMAALALVTLLGVSTASLETELVGKYGEAQRARVTRGLAQVQKFWRKEDGDDAALFDFARRHFAGDPKTLDALFERLEFVLESMDGHSLEIGRDLQRQSALDLGPIYPFDEILAGYDPSA